MMVKKTIKYIAYFILSIVAAVNLFILLSGRYYLYSGIAKTYLIGKMGPGIYDLDVFPVNKIPKSTKENKLQVNFSKASITDKEEQYLNEIDTRAFLIFQNDTLIHEQYWGDHSIDEVSNEGWVLFEDKVFFRIRFMHLSRLIISVLVMGFIESKIIFLASLTELVFIS